MGGYALLICRSQTEAIGLRRHLARLGVPGEVARPPRHERTESCGWAVTPAHIAGQERRLVHELARALSRESKIECFAGKEQTGVLSFRVPGTPSEVLADMLSDEGVCTRAGLHCAPLAHRTAGTEDTGTVRLSLSFYSTARQLEQAADKVCRLVKKL